MKSAQSVTNIQKKTKMVTQNWPNKTERSTILVLDTTKVMSDKNGQEMSLTWGNIDLAHLGLGDVDVYPHFAVCEVNLYVAQVIRKLTEQQETTGVPGPELETDGKQILVKPSRDLQVTCGIKKDRYRIGLHTRETQISLKNKKGKYEVKWASPSNYVYGAINLRVEREPLPSVVLVGQPGFSEGLGHRGCAWHESSSSVQRMAI